MDEPGGFDCLFLCERKTEKEKVLESLLLIPRYLSSMERDDDDDYRMMMTILDVTAPKVHLPHFLTCNAKIHDGFQLLPARMERSPRVNYCDPTGGWTCTNRSKGGT